MVVDLQQAEEAIKRSDLNLAAKLCKQAIEDDDSSHDANLWVFILSCCLSITASSAQTLQVKANS